MRSKRSQEGYLSLDHRDSPGTTREFVASTGRAAPAVAGGTHHEAPTFTCPHCQRVVIMNMARTRPRGYCRSCDSYTCDSPGCNIGCNPFIKYLDQMQELALKAEQAGAALAVDADRKVGSIILP